MCPECLVLPEMECVNLLLLIRSLIFHNLPSSGENCDTGLDLKGLPYLKFGILCKIFGCDEGGKVDC